MNKRNVPIFKFDRRLGVNIFGLAKSPLNAPRAKNLAHARKTRKSTYHEKLSEKQKMKVFYGLSESYIRRVLEYSKCKGQDPVLRFFRKVESRLDNAFKRCGFTKANGFARQIINHKHVMVNGNIVNIPSYHLKPGDIVSFKKSKASEGIIKTCKDNIVSCQRAVPKERYEVDDKELTIKMVGLPTKLSEIKYDFELDFVKALSYYSK